jgi:hypothetical protein
VLTSTKVLALTKVFSLLGTEVQTLTQKLLCAAPHAPVNLDQLYEDTYILVYEALSYECMHCSAGAGERGCIKAMFRY